MTLCQTNYVTDTRVLQTFQCVKLNDQSQHFHVLNRGTTMRIKQEEKFDEKYYERFYHNTLTQVASPEQNWRASALVMAWMKHLDVKISDVIEFGCGTGHVREVVQEHYPDASYLGVEISVYACEQYGWTQGNIEDFNAGMGFDLVVCRDVLQYLDDARAEQAIANLTRHTRYALWFDALTQEDWDHHCDRERTDGEAHLREANWYRDKLKEEFWNIGGGVFIKRCSGLVIYALERAA